MILIQAHLDQAVFADVFPRYNEFFQWYGYRPGELLRGIGISELSNVTKREYLMDGAWEVAEKLVRGV